MTVVGRKITIMQIVCAQNTGQLILCGCLDVFKINVNYKLFEHLQEIVLFLVCGRDANFRRFL